MHFCRVIQNKQKSDAAEIHGGPILCGFKIFFFQINWGENYGAVKFGFAHKLCLSN